METHTHSPQTSPATHFDRWLPRASRGCETVWIEFQKKKEITYTHTLMHRRARLPTQPINRMTLAQLSLNYISATVPSISIRPNVILFSIMPLHPSSISHPSSPPSFSSLTHSSHTLPPPDFCASICVHIRVFILREVLKYLKKKSNLRHEGNWSCRSHDCSCGSNFRRMWR